MIDEIYYKSKIYNEKYNYRPYFICFSFGKHYLKKYENCG